VGNNQGLTGIEPQDKALMAASVLIVRQDLDDNAVSFRLNTTFVFVEGVGQSPVALNCKAHRIVSTVALRPTNVDGYEKNNDREQLFHGDTI